jgi:hypothetical protein
MKPILLCASLCAGLLPTAVSAFCGFYVAKADSKLYNKSSQVVLVRDGKATSITMASDYQGDAKDFALVIPVPTVVDKKDVQVVEKALLDHLDAYSAPRLVEYWDHDPDQPQYPFMPAAPAPAMARSMAPVDGARAKGVSILRSFSAGEYDILVLSAEQSDGLLLWLNENGYKMPEGAAPVLDSYIRQSMKFFVAKVNLERQAKEGRTWLRPIRVSFNTRKYMLPIRLGTVNAEGAQDMIVYALSRNGRVESTNYRSVRLPTNVDIPEYVKESFGEFYLSMFDLAAKKENHSAIFTEYFWDLGWCDPCSSDPLTLGELRKLGCDWLKEGEDSARPESGAAFITRLHVRYDREHFPEDIVFQETGDAENLQGRYVMHHPWTGKSKSEAAKAYFAELPKRREKEAQTLAGLTGWEIGGIREKQASYKDKSKRNEMGDS